MNTAQATMVIKPSGPLFGEMAARLGISANTVETHRQKLKQKLGADSQHALLKLALAHTGRALPGRD